ncbi:MAG TPA: primary-amine oxidase [Kribbella sp.]|jgi:primary-amine oxidase
MTARLEVERPATHPVSHPLEPLSAAEVAAASAIVRKVRELPASTRFITITLHEPPKERVLALREGEQLDREAFVVLRDREQRATYETVVSLTLGELLSWREVPGAQPGLTFGEFLACEDVVRADPRWQAAMRERGVTDFSLAMIDPWSAGYTGAADDPGRHRICRPLTFLRSKPDENGYARPVEGLIATVDLDRMEVIDVEDHGVVPLPPRPGNYVPEMLLEPGNWPAVNVLREDVRPVEISQPDGPSFTVDGHAVSWQKWRLRVGFTPREGLVLHQVSYLDQDRLRPVIYRASLSEMYIPYGDPSPTHYRKNVFDEGEYGVGFMVNSLELGCDCLGEIHYFDAVVNDDDGSPVTLPNAVCLHEEDVGVGWKHTDFRTNKVEVRRSRRLVVSCFATVGNYEYGYFWYLYQDGTIQYEVKLTGVISTGAYSDGVSAYGSAVAPGLYGPNHQHFFNVRLDMCVDGERNSVYEVDSRPVPIGPENPHGNAWTTAPVRLESESQAQRIINPLVGRYWTVVSSQERNGLGQPTAYKLQPGDNVLPLQQEDSQAYRRAGFAFKHLWVTAYDPGQRYAAGDYPNQNPGGGGLPDYTSGDRPLVDADVVLWYTFGAHHVVRPEDWPVMPVSYAGFHLKPVGFFDGNPALDLPRPHHHPVEPTPPSS